MNHPSPPAPSAEANVLEAFLKQHASLIRRVVRHVGGWRAEQVREDVEQEVLMAVWRRLHSEQTLDLTPSYVYTATMRETVRAMKVVQERAKRDVDGTTERASGAEGPFEAVARRESREGLEASLKALGPERERAARLHLQGFRIEEIMRLTGWPYQKARNLVSRAMADLRAALRERGIDA